MDSTRRLDEIYATLPQVRCKGLCQEACGPVLMSKAEWQRVLARLGYWPHAKPHPKKLKDLACPMLHKGSGKCRVYDVRPMVCRLWGVVETMRCPHGCVPDKMLTKEEGYQFLGEAGRIGGG